MKIEIMVVLWTESYSVNIEELDRQYKKLFEMFNNFEHMMQFKLGSSPIMTIVSEMKRYALMHFACEEKIMQDRCYNEIDYHKAKHKEFQNKFIFYEDKLFKGRAILPNEISDFLQNWLITHILEEDKGYVEFYKTTKI